MVYVTTLCMAIAAQAPSTAETDVRCGSYCLYTALKALDVPVGSYAELEEKLGDPGLSGYSLAQLDDAARGYGAHTLGVETSVASLRLRERPFACIAHVDQGHFLLISDVDDALAYIVDPPRQYPLPLDTLRARWDGKALLIARQPLAAEEDLRAPWPLARYAAVGALALAVVWLTYALMRRRKRP